MPSFEPVFEVMALADYWEIRTGEADRILGATIFTPEQDEITGLNVHENICSLQPVNTEPWVELYRFQNVSESPAIVRRHNGELSISYTGDFAFGHWETTLPSPGLVEETTLRAYRSILDALRKLNHFHLWRCWNVIPDIHERKSDLDHYMQFCLGRHRALVTEERLPGGKLPAASAVGSHDNRFQISFIAGKASGEAFENPEQISAYAYPRQYGPASPSFSRSLFAGHHLWLSGTASIAGHQSVHATDLSAQVHETAARITTLVESVQDEKHTPVRPPEHLKVYLRHRDSADRLMPVLEAAFPEGTSYHLVEADICRDDLLIEIEGVTT
ncbi:MAG: hypothetical protein P1U86_08670 [Verrucomicrobiales bacterium]|nr:hypothetical protein [Verrucomicrobiales bacterium]